MDILLDPVVVGLLGKILAGVVILLLAIGFVPGVIVGWIAGRITKG